MGMICAVSFCRPTTKARSSLEQLAARFLVSVGWAKKISAQRKRSGQAERVPHKPGRKPHAGVEAQSKVMAWMRAQPDLTLAELQAKLYSEAGRGAQPGAGLASVAKAGSASEKKSLHATERDTEANLKRREEFAAKIRTITPEHLIFLDESGVTTSMTRLYARSLGGSASMKPRPAATGKS